MDLDWCLTDVPMIKFPMSLLPFSVNYPVQCISAFLMKYIVHRGWICLTSVILFVKDTMDRCLHSWSPGHNVFGCALLDQFSSCPHNKPPKDCTQCTLYCNLLFWVFLCIFYHYESKYGTESEATVKMEISIQVHVFFCPTAYFLAV